MAELMAFLSMPVHVKTKDMEAFVDSLASEMARFDVKVSIIEPGNYESNIGDSLVKRMKSRGFETTDDSGSLAAVRY